MAEICELWKDRMEMALKFLEYLHDLALEVAKLRDQELFSLTPVWLVSCLQQIYRDTKSFLLLEILQNNPQVNFKNKFSVNLWNIY